MFLLLLNPQQWFNMYAPVRLAVDESFPDNVDDNLSSASTNFPVNSIPVNKLDTDKIFKGKSDRSKNKSSQNKKTNSNKTQARKAGSGRNLPVR